MTQSWGYTGSPPSLGGPEAAHTLIEGSLFCVCSGNGDISGGTGPHGLFFRDLRSLSRWELRIDGHRPEVLATYRPEPSVARYVSRVPPRPGRADSHLLVVRERQLADGMREDLTIRNLGQETAGCAITLLLDADFADLFEVKENRVTPHPDRITTNAPDAAEVQFSYRWLGNSRDVLITCVPEPVRTAGMLTFAVAIPPKSQWRSSFQVRFVVHGVLVEAGYASGGGAELGRASRRRREWGESGPVVTAGFQPLEAAVRTGQEDLGALRISEPEHPEQQVVAAGAPWFMTVFGRDSLLTAWMALLVDPSLAVGTLKTLARFQGTRVDALTEEQPGRVLHEMRFGAQAGLALGGGNVYYGTADATPLFVMLLGEAHDWGLPAEDLAALLPHADAALTWMTEYGDKDGDGFLEYQRATDQGLANQGWKDSFDGINFASGALADPPIALCEVQGYAYGAYLARSALAADAGDRSLAEHWAERARRLKVAFNESFWLPRRGYFAVALDRDKRPVDALSSNIGHCLWTGIVDEDKAAQAVSHLMSEPMFSGWGVRTLASTMGAYNPLSYHNGSVWPHDNAVLVAGLFRYGFVEQAHVLCRALLDAGSAFGSRLPELWSGFDRTDFDAPLPYPTSCSPQAWAAAAPLLILRSLLGLRPQLPQGRLAWSPRIPADFLPLSIDNLHLGRHRLQIRVDGAGARIHGLPDGIEVVGVA